LRKTLVSFAALGLLALAPAAAQASPCSGEPPSSQVFSAYDGDPDFYFLAPGGDFGSAAPAWTLDHAFTYGSALVLPPGSSATSPPVCVGKGYPHGRMYGAGFSFRKTKLKVDVIYNGERSAESTKLALRRFELAPTDRFSLDESAFGLDPVTGTASIQLVLTPSGGTAVLDDVYIDPSARN
jgi:hypothetical protein